MEGAPDNSPGAFLFVYLVLLVQAPLFVALVTAEKTEYNNYVCTHNGPEPTVKVINEKAFKC